MKSCTSAPSMTAREKRHLAPLGLLVAAANAAMLAEKPIPAGAPVQQSMPFAETENAPSQVAQTIQNQMTPKKESSVVLVLLGEKISSYPTQQAKGFSGKHQVISAYSTGDIELFRGTSRKQCKKETLQWI